MAEAYKVINAVTIPKATTRLEDDVEGNARYATTGVLYEEGQYVRESDISPPLRERAASGEFPQLEPVSSDELEAVERELARAGQFATFAPEHEVERVTLKSYGHEVLTREQIIEANSAGADAARSTQEAAVADGASDRPAITEADTFQEVPSLVEASNEGKTVLPRETPQDAPEFDAEADGVQTMPSGVEGGATKLAAEGGEVKESEGAARKPRARKRPGANDSGGASKKENTGDTKDSE